MAKIAFLNVPAHGHVNPTLPVVAELKRRGHQILYYNTDDFQPQIERAGAEFRSYPRPQMSQNEISQRAGNLVRVTLLLFSASERLLPFVMDELRREQPDVVIHDSICLWGWQAAHLLQRPAVSSITTLVLEGVSGLLTWRDWLHLLRGALPRLPRMLLLRRHLVRKYGQEVFPDGPIFPATGALNVVYTSRGFQPDTPFVDDSFHFVGPSIDEASRQDVDFPFDALTGTPLVYISLGTVHHANRDFYRTTFEAFGHRPGQFVLSVGRQTDPSDLEPIPANFIVRQVVPQLQLLQHVGLFVTHGGINSVHEGLYYGVPLVVVPQQMEQLLNGRRVVAGGAGLLLGDKPPYGRVTAAELREAVETVLHEERYREAAAQLGEGLRNAGGYPRAVDAIEAFTSQTTGA